MKIAHLLVTLLFLLFAYWQINDPDSARWIALYVAVSVVAGWNAFSTPPRWVPGLLLGVIVLWLLTLLPDFINWLRLGAPTITGQMKAESPHVELTREFLGLAICGGALYYYFRRSARARSV